MPVETFLYRQNGAMHGIKIDEIFFLTADDSCTKFYTPSGHFMLRITLDVALTMLPTDIFMRIHECHAVSVIHIDTISEDTVITSKGIKLPIAKELYEGFIAQLNILD